MLPLPCTFNIFRLFSLQCFWNRHNCFQTMGVHYFNFGYDENADICEELTPFQLMYIDNKLNGFVWQHNANLTGFSSTLIFLFTFWPAGHVLGIWVCGCSLFYKRELWASKSVGAHSTKSLKISGCKRWYPKDLQVRAPAAPLLTHSLCDHVFNMIW